MTTHLDSSLQTALQADGPLHGFAVEIDYPSFTLRLLDGSGVVALNGNTFTGLDATYGALILPEEMSDGTDAAAPNISFGIQVPSTSAIANLVDPSAQGSAVTLWYYGVNRATGVAYTPYQVWTGALDVATLHVGNNSRIVQIDAESYFGPFNDSADGNLLSNACHQAIWSGEAGLEYVVDVQQLMPWGSDSPRPVVIKDVLNGNNPASGGGGTQGGGANGSGSPLSGTLLGLLIRSAVS